MTRNDRFKKIKSRLIILLALICAFSSTFFVLTACNKDDEAYNDPDYTYTETDDGKIANADFAYNMSGKDFSDFPVTSPTGWSKSTDNSTSSSVNSGIIDVSEKGWKEFLDTLYEDGDFVDYIKTTQKGVIITAIREEKGNAEYEPTDTEIEDYIEEHKSDFISNPGKYSDDADDYMFMLNNYTTESFIGFGTAQKVTSSSSVTIEAGKIYKLGVNVKTVNLYGANSSAEYANIRLTNSISGNSQAEYRIGKINTQGEWKNYSVYIKADKDYDSTFTLVLALGYSGKNSSDGKYFTEGTAYFDNITFDEVDQIPSSVASTDALTYGSSDKIAIDASSNTSTEYVYDMSLENTYSNLTAITSYDIPFAPTSDSNSYHFTKSNIAENGTYLTSKNVAPDSSAEAVLNDNTLKLTLNKASYTVRISSEEFKLAGKTFGFVTFDLTNKLNKLSSVDITVDVFEKVGTEYKKTSAVTTYSESSDDAIKCELLFKNNFETAEQKEFYIEIVIGPADVVSTANAYDFATGEVTISDIEFFKGSLESENYETADYITGTDNPEYKLYSFFSANADATVALYKGYSSDYTEEDDSETYSLNVASGNIGDIVSYPTAAQNYFGITANHVYLKEQVDGETLSTAVNDRAGTFAGSFAGLINTKYLSTYETNGGTGLADALEDAYKTDENIQPLAIYNNEKDHYGFVGISNTIAASAYAKVSVTLRVFDISAGEKATAYIYIVDTSGKDKQVMEFVMDDKSVRKLQLTVTSDMMDDEGWVTVDFYIGVGATSKEFRVEVWNGGRDNDASTASKGYVFVKDITVTTSGAFTEPTSAAQAFTVLSGNPLAEATKSAFDDGELLTYTRPLTETEIKFNKEYPDNAVSYNENYVWAQNDVMIYAIYNTIDPVESNPYDSIEDNEDTDGSGCNATGDPSAFWLSFSSILLAAILILAIIALIVKHVRRRIKANKSDAKSHFKVKSRIELSKDAKKLAAKKKAREEKEAAEAEEYDVKENDDILPSKDDTANEENKETPVENQDLDDYVYGEVEDFGDAATNEDTDNDSDSENTEPQNKE